MSFRLIASSFGLGTSAAFASVVIATALLPACVQPTNPFDPRTPLESQAPVTIQGRIQSVTTPVVIDGEEVILEAASCDVFDGNHAGFEVVLRGLGFEGDTGGIRAASRLTEVNGLFLFNNAPPGDYTVEFIRPGFEVPPPITLTLSPGEVVTVPTRCALKTSAPDRPFLGILPGRTTATTLDVTVADCDRDPGFRTQVTRSGTGESITSLVPTEAGGCTVTFPLVDEDARDFSSYLFSATTTDALGNVSPAVERNVIYDTRPPPAPTPVTLVPSATRLDIAWTFAPPVDDDDGAARSIVSYSVLPRPEDAAQTCPFGTPVEGDAFEVAAFAAEGQSPLSTTQTTLALSEVPTGTSIWVQVAGVDALGNRGCFSAPALARVDQMTVTPVAPVDVGVIGPTATAAGVVATALGSGGLSLVAPDGTVTLATAPAFDVVANARQFFGASGEAGISEVEVSETGTVVGEIVHAIGTVRSVAKRPGVVVIGTDIGVRFAADSDIANTVTGGVDPGAQLAPVAQIENFGDGLVLLRSTQPPRVQLVRRDDPSLLLGTLLLNEAPSDLVMTADAVWLALGNGRIQRVSLASCRAAIGDLGATVGPEELGCLAPETPLPLPAPAAAKILLPLDDTVVVAAERTGDAAATGLYVLDVSGAPVWVGQAPLPSDVFIRGLSAQDLQLCALTREGNDDRQRCFELFFLSRISRTENLSSGVSVSDVRATADRSFVAESAGGDLASFAPGVVRAAVSNASVAHYTFSSADSVVDDGPEVFERFPIGAPRALALAEADGVGAFVLDQYGRLHFASASSPSDSPLRLFGDAFADALIADATALVSETGAGSSYVSLTSAFVERDGGDLIVGLSNIDALGGDACTTAVLARVRPIEDVTSGELSLAPVEVLPLGGAIAVSRIAVVAGQARLTVAPFGLYRATLGSTLTSVAGLAPTCDGSALAETVAIDIVHASSNETWVTARRDENGALVAGLFLIDSANVVTRLDARLPADPVVGVRSGDALVLATQNDGAFLLDTSGDAPWFPKLTLPDVRDARIVRATSRGFVVADGAFGAKWFVLQ